MIAPPGSAFAYSDTGYNLLELVMEDCTGESFAAYMKREVMQPLGMTQATFNTDVAPVSGFRGEQWEHWNCSGPQRLAGCKIQEHGRFQCAQSRTETDKVSPQQGVSAFDLAWLCHKCTELATRAYWCSIRVNGSEEKMPLGYDLRKRSVAPYVYPGRASGGLLASATDIARFAAAGMASTNQDVLSPAGVTALHRPVVSVTGLFGFAAQGYGLGHFTETLSDGRAAVWHGGQGYGWMSHMHLVQESGDAIVLLSNSQRAWPLFATILQDWSTSLGVEPVGMARVLWAEKLARVLTAFGLAVTILAYGIALYGPLWSLCVRIGVGGLGMLLIAWPLWAMAQDYLFLFSILPGLWPWLAATSGLAGSAFCAIALVPAIRHARHSA